MPENAVSEETRAKISETQKRLAPKRRKTRRKSKGQGSVYRRKGAQTWTVAWTQHGTQQFEHGFPDEDTAERFRKLKVVDVAEGRDLRLQKRKATGTLSELVEAWLKIRFGTHRSADQDGYRWANHLKPAIGHLAPDDVDVSTLRKLIEVKLAEGLAPATVQLLVRLVSTLYTDLIEDGVATKNPARMLPKKTRQRIRPAHDPKKTPYVEKREDIGRLFQALPEPTNIAYAISALAGLRPGEARALKWINVDLDRRKIYVRESVKGPTKDKDSREAPIVQALYELLTAWQDKNPNPHNGLVCPPMQGATRKFLDDHTIGKRMRDACKAIGLPPMTFYETGRHSFASHWVLAGGSIEKLRVILGHSTVLVTERYAHLKVDQFSKEDLERANISLAT
jgi:integrase